MASYALLAAFLYVTGAHLGQADQKVVYSRVNEYRESMLQGAKNYSIMWHLKDLISRLTNRYALGMLFNNSDDVADSSLTSETQQEEMVITAVSNGCQCTTAEKTCSCCATIWLTSVCINIKPLTAQIGFYMSITIAGNIYFETNITMKSPPPMCLKVPLLGELCLIFYNLTWNKGHLEGCSRLDLTFSGQAKQFQLGCFSLDLETGDNLALPAGCGQNGLQELEMIQVEQKTENNDNLFLRDTKTEDKLNLFRAKLFRDARRYDRKV